MAACLGTLDLIAENLQIIAEYPILESYYESDCRAMAASVPSAYITELAACPSASDEVAMVANITTCADWATAQQALCIALHLCSPPFLPPLTPPPSSPALPPPKPRPPHFPPVQPWCPPPVSPPPSPSTAHAICCLAMTASCLACSNGVMEEEYCAQFPGESGCPPLTDARHTRDHGTHGLGLGLGLGGGLFLALAMLVCIFVKRRASFGTAGGKSCGGGCCCKPATPAPAASTAADLTSMADATVEPIRMDVLHTSSRHPDHAGGQVVATPQVVVARELDHERAAIDHELEEHPPPIPQRVSASEDLDAIVICGGPPGDGSSHTPQYRRRLSDLHDPSVGECEDAVEAACKGAGSSPKHRRPASSVVEGRPMELHGDEHVTPRPGRTRRAAQALARARDRRGAPRGSVGEIAVQIRRSIGGRNQNP